MIMDKNDYNKLMSKAFAGLDTEDFAKQLEGCSVIISSSLGEPVFVGFDKATTLDVGVESTWWRKDGGDSDEYILEHVQRLQLYKELCNVPVADFKIDVFRAALDYLNWEGSFGVILSGQKMIALIQSSEKYKVDPQDVNTLIQRVCRNTPNIVDYISEYIDTYGKETEDNIGNCDGKTE
jgi:hypothetical protein